MMAYAGVQMFMEKLNQLINSNHSPLFNNPEIICEKPQLQLLYQELGSMIQTLFIHQPQDLHDLEKVGYLKKRFTYAAEEAEYNIDLFLSGVHIRNTTEDLPTSGVFKRSLNLDNVRRSLKSVEEEFMSMRIDSMKMESSQRLQRTLNQYAHAPISLGSKKLSDEIFVGIDREAKLIIDKLVEDQKKLDVVSIVGMGGIGKTTLATKVFNNSYVKHHFHVRVWVTVSQTYDKRAVLTQIVESIRGQLHLEKATDFQLRELVHKNLIGKRYLIVVDDIWDIETWDNLKVFFPNDNNGSRILLTSRLTKVAKHANSDGLIHHLGYLNKEKGWELLCQKVFHGNECPDWSIKPGMKIVENCQGLPLALVVIAGILAKEALNEKFWEEIVVRTGSYLVDDKNGCMETLGLSYNHLPLHLRECFLYLGGFPEDSKFHMQILIWLWVAEGFIQQDENRSLEDIAEGYLMDLIDRNLITVANRYSSGGVKFCILHDFVRELCLKKAKEERHYLITNSLILTPQFSDFITQAYKPVRVFADDDDINMLSSLYSPALNVRSILCYSKFRPLSNDTAKCVRSFVLLKVLDLIVCKLNEIPYSIELLVHLRYLAIWDSSYRFPSSICKLWNLETLIYYTDHGLTCLPSNISDLVNLRHLKGYPSRKRNSFYLPSIEKPMKLQTISHVTLDWIDNFQKCFPCIKELTCACFFDKQSDFKPLICLEKLNFGGFFGSRILEHLTFPSTLKSLSMAGCALRWSEMSIIQSLPNLQVLKLRHNSFEGSCWNTYEQEFPKLNFLKLECLNVKQWEVYSASFPCLRKLEIFRCEHLEEVPLEIGDIPTLELIQVKFCSHSVGESVRRIQEEQNDLGNFDLKIDTKLC